jgi:hypothetical protein
VSCREVRFEIGSDPDAPLSQAAAEHLATCADCTQYRREMQRLERDLRRALGDPPAAAGPTAASAGRHVRPMRHQWAIAASLVVIGFGLLFWSVRPTTSLAADVVAHVAAEPMSWVQTEPVSTTDVDSILRRTGMALTGTHEVVYARTCVFRGREVPHLVVRTAAGPFTVLILPDEIVTRPEHFRESGYSGIFLPQRGGTLAVLGLGNTTVDAVAPQVASALRSTR